jgi:riboflavin kinase
MQATIAVTQTKLLLQDDILQDLSVTDEDRSIARDGLDLPTFSEYAHDLHFS